jgi:phosphate starvation-inducible protein PhoH
MAPRDYPAAPTKKEARKGTKKAAGKKSNTFGLQIGSIRPRTETQRQVFEAYHQAHLLLHGAPGTGKSFLTMFLGLRDILENREYERFVIIRSTVPTRDVGFLPGTIEEKMSVYEAPYREICAELFERGDAYDLLRHHGYIEFLSTSFVRGTTLRNAVVFVDEVQNMTDSELNTVITRLGEGCKLIVAGDIRQCDLQKERSGVVDFFRIARAMKDQFEVIEFQSTDIVRSEFVKSYILTRLDLEDSGAIKPLMLGRA